MSTLKAREFLKKNEAKLALLVGFLLVSGLSFEAGVLWGQKWQQKPLIIEKSMHIAQEGGNTVSGPPESPSNVSEQKTDPAVTGKCPYVGSKKSSKFYLSSCPWAKQIKPENIICFSSAAEAIAQGRTESKCQ